MVQPAELVGTDRYKIGCSGNPSLDRCKKGYRQGTRYLHIMECNNPFNLENTLKIKFNERFSLVAGKEYFKGSESDIKDEFIKITQNYISTDNDCNSDINNISTDNDCNSDINNINMDSSKFSLKSHLINSYECITCNYKTKDRGNICRHNKTKKHLVNLSNISNTENKNKSKIYTNICKYCNRSFSRPDTLSKHINTCKSKQDLNYDHKLELLNLKLNQCEKDIAHQTKETKYYKHMLMEAGK